MASKQIASPVARYVLTASYGTAAEANLKLKDRATDKSIASLLGYRREAFYAFGYRGPRYCPSSDDIRRGSHLTALVLAEAKESVSAQETSKLRYTCELPLTLPTSAEFHLIRAQGTAGLDLPGMSSGSGWRALSAQIVVNRPGKNVFLWLQAHDPVVWNVSYTPETRVAGVVVGAYYIQAVLGVPGSAPLLMHTTEYAPASNCLELQIGVQLSRLGEELGGYDTYELDGTGTVVIGDKVKPEELIRSSDRPIGNFMLDPSGSG